MTDETPDTELPDTALPGTELPPEATEHLRARLEAPPAPDGVLDRARAAALDAFDEVHDRDGTPAEGVRAISSAPTARRETWYQRAPFGAAAAVVVAVALVGAVSQLDLSGNDGDDSATAAVDETSEELGDSEGAADSDSIDLEAAEDSISGGGDEGSLDAGAGGGGSSSNQRAPLAGPDGSVRVYDDLDALVDVYRNRYVSGDDGAEPPPATTSTRSGEFGADSCDAVAVAGADPARVLEQRYASLGPAADPSFVVAVVYESDASGLRVAVVDAESCDLLADRAL